MDKKIKILHLENSLKDSELIHAIIECGGIEHEYFCANNEKDYIKILEEEKIDLILSNYSMPDYNGGEALKFAREKYAQIPFIFISGTIEKDAAIHAKLNGASDFVIKEKTERLVPAIKAALNEYEKKSIRKQAEEALYASEIRYRRLFESAKDGILILDAETGMIMDVNPFLIELLGYSKEQFLEKEIWEIGFFKDIIANRDKFLELQTQEYVRYEDLPLETVNGQKINVEFVSNVYIENKQKVIQCNIRDITKHMSTENALKKSEIEFRAIFEQAGVGVAVVNTKTGQIIRINQKYCDMVGYTVEEMIQKTFMDITYPEDIQFNIDKNAELIEGTNTCFSFDKRYVHKDGNIIWGNVTISPMWKIDDKPQTYIHIAIVENINARKIAEEALKISEKKFRSYIENAPDGVFVVDEKGCYIEVNKAACEITGYSEHELLNMSVMDITPPESKEKAKNIFLKLVSTGYSSDEIYFRHKNGTNIMWSVEAVKLSDSRFLCFAKDISERKKMHEELIALSKRLEAILASVQEIVIEVDNKKVIIWANNAGLEFFGEDCIGKEASYYFEGEQDTYQTVQPIFDGNENNIYVESWQKRKDGKKRLLAWFCKTLKDKNGNTLGALSSARDITERKMAEKQIIDLAKFPEENPNPIYRISKDGLLLYANPASKKIISKIPSAIGEKINEKWMGIFKNTHDSGKKQEIEIELDGRIFLFNIVPVAESGYINVYATDITEQKKAENFYKISEAKYRAFFESSMDAIILTSPDGGIISANPAACTMFGFTERELISIGRAGIVDVTDPRLPSLLEKREKTGKASGQLTFIRKVGTRFPAELTSATFLDANNQLRTSIIIRDISEQKEAEEALKKSEKKFRSYIENAPDGIFIADETGHFVETNKAACDILGYTMAEILNLNIHELLAEESLDDGVAHFKKVIDTGKARSDLLHKHKDGSTRWLEINAVKLSQTRILGFAKDISERKLAEDEIKKNIEELEQFHRLSVDREMRMIELKQQINALHKQLGESGKYKIDFFNENIDIDK